MLRSASLGQATVCEHGEMDPLTAVVILAIAGAAAAVSIMQMDQDATDTVTVSLEDFQSGELPAVCCKTGKPAQVGVTVVKRRFFRTVAEGIVPITKARHIEFTGWKDINRWATWALFPVFLVGALLDAMADSIVVSWAVSIAVLAVVFIQLYSNAKGRRLLLTPRLGPVAESGERPVTLRSVHPTFADAVRRSRQSAV